MQFIEIKKPGSRAIIFIIAFILGLFSYYNLWNKSRLTVDAPSYYAYLPATTLHQDLHLTYIDQNPEFYRGKIWFINTPDGKRVIKNPVGISVMLSPFFMVGHGLALLTGADVNGYSMPYQNACSLGVLLYLLIGLYYLRKTLLAFFSESIVALVLLSVVLGTNLLWYATFEGFMSHAVSFSIWCVGIYLFIQWLKTDQKKYLLLFSVAFGLSMLIRPLSIIFALYFITYALIYKGSLPGFLLLLRNNIRSLLISVLIILVIVSIQLCYWKYATGTWLYDVYGEEHFIWSKPETLSFLFGFRKGLFIYVPVLLFSVVGLIVLFKRNKALFYATLFLMAPSVYLLSAWWAWTHGICWGLRPVIDYYPVLCLPMGFAFTCLSSKGKLSSVLLYATVSLFIALNLFQTWQYKNGLIHFDDMSKEAYFKGFFQTEKTDEWTDLLKPYDWERRIHDLDQIEYSGKFFTALTPDQRVYLRASNIAFITVNSKAQNAMAALAKDYGQQESFYITHLKGDTIAIQSNNKLYWSYKPDYENAVTASETVVGANEKFTCEYLSDNDNRIAIKAINGKYISFDNQWPFIIKADKDAMGKNEVFRYFIYDNKQ